MDGENSQPGTMTEAEVLKVELTVLRRTHRQLDEQITAIESESAPDALQIRQLKQEKLRLKDMIAKIEARLYPDILA